MKYQFISRMMGLTLFVLACSSVSLAQTARITGRITDTSDAVIQGANITVTHASSFPETWFRPIAWIRWRATCCVIIRCRTGLGSRIAASTTLPLRGRYPSTSISGM